MTGAPSYSLPIFVLEMGNRLPENYGKTVPQRSVCAWFVNVCSS
jgi:hypothetical protein